MTARDLISKDCNISQTQTARRIDANASVFDTLPRLLDTPSLLLGVEQDGILNGVIDSRSMLEGLRNVMCGHDGCSVIVVKCPAEDYSASLIAHAVEDADAHLVNLLTSPGDNGQLKVTLQVRLRDPQAAIRNLERYGYNVTEAYGESPLPQSALEERLAALQVFLNV